MRCGEQALASGDRRQSASDLGQAMRGCSHSSVTAVICRPGDSCLGKEKPLDISKPQSLVALTPDNTTGGPRSEPLAGPPSIPATAAELAPREPRVKGKLAGGRHLGFRAGKKARRAGRAEAGRTWRPTVCISFLQTPGLTCPSCCSPGASTPAPTPVPSPALPGQWQGAALLRGEASPGSASQAESLPHSWQRRREPHSKGWFSPLPVERAGGEPACVSLASEPIGTGGGRPRELM